MRSVPGSEAEVSAALRQLAGAAPPLADHPDPPRLAAYLDRALGSSELAEMEAHLAACRPCRELAAETAVGLAEAGEPMGGAVPIGRPFRLVLAAAAVVIVAAGSVLVLRLGGPATPPTVSGIDPALLATSDGELAAQAVAALNGVWPPLSGFEQVPEPAAPPVMRDAASRAPLPLAPRWGAVAAARPTFAWAPPADGRVAEYEVLAVDAEERFVLSFAAPSPADPGLVTATFPADAAPLLPGRAYAWKVNALVDGEWSASEYVPFRVLPDEERARLEERLAAAGDSPLLRAVAYEAHGLHDAALAELEALAARPDGAEAADRLAAAVRERQRLPRALGQGLDLGPPEAPE